MPFLEISWNFGILGFSKILGFFQRFIFIFDDVYEDFQSNLPLGSYIIKLRNCLNSFSTKSQVLSCARGWRLCMFIYSVQCTIVLVIVAIYDQARSYIIKLRNWLNSFSTTLYVHIFGSVHAMPILYNTTIRFSETISTNSHNSFSHYQHCSDLWPLKV
jgi:hypothetical protein